MKAPPEVCNLGVTFDLLLERLFRLCIETVPVERAVLLQKKAGLDIRASWKLTGEVTLHDFPLPASEMAPVTLLEHVLDSGRILVLGEASSDMAFRTDPYFTTHNVRSALAVPVCRSECRLGVLYFEDGTSTYSKDRIDKLLSISSEIALVLEDSRLVEESALAAARIRILSEASAALAESLNCEACLTKLSQIIVPAIADWWAVDELDDGTLRNVASAHADAEKAILLKELYGNPPVDLNSTHPQAVVFRSGTPMLMAQDELPNPELWNDHDRRAAETLKPRSMIIVPIVNRKRTLGTVTLVRSRLTTPYGTEDLRMVEELARRIGQTLENARLHRRLREALRQRIERDRYLSFTFRQFPGSVWTVDRNLRFSYVAGRVMQKINPPARVGMSLYEFLGTRDPTNISIAHHFAALSGERQSYEYELAGRWYTTLLEPLKDKSAQVTGCLGVAFDVTEQRRLEERMKRDEERLNEAQRVAHIGSFEWDIDQNIVTWSDELHRIYGFRPGQFGRTFEAFLERVDPRDIDLTKSAVSEALRNVKPFTYDHRIIRADGSVRTLHTRGDVVVDGNGKPVRIVGSCWDITDLKAAMDGLVRTRSLLEATIEATADGLLVVDINGKVKAYNQRFLTLWRIPPDLVRQHDDDKLLEFVLDQLQDPNDFRSSVHDLYAHPDRESVDIIRFKDGRVFERYSVPQRVRAEIVGRVWSFRDVTERERLFRRALFLADATRLLASLDVEPALDSVAHLAVPYIGDVCAVDLLGNGGPRRLLVVSRDPTQPINPELHGTALAGYSTIYMFGQRSCMVVPLVIKGDVIGALTFIASPTRRYTSQDLDLAEELGRRAALSVDNANLYRNAQEALKARDEFLSIAAHEIRGPITSIHMAVQGLQRGQAPAHTMPKLFDIIEREDRRLSSFVDELLDLGSIRTGQIRFSFEQVDLGQLVHEVSSRLRSELSKTGSSLSITSVGQPVGQWDRFRLEQVVTNLLSNAMKFGLGKPIVVSVEEHDGITTLVVKDKGIGIPSEMLEQIFKPFERVESVRHYGGLGLGLFIVKTIVESLGGRVRVQSERNAGSTFTVELPKAKAT